MPPSTQPLLPPYFHGCHYGVIAINMHYHCHQHFPWPSPSVHSLPPLLPQPSRTVILANTTICTATTTHITFVATTTMPPSPLQPRALPPLSPSPPPPQPCHPTTSSPPINITDDGTITTTTTINAFTNHHFSFYRFEVSKKINVKFCV